MDFNLTSEQEMLKNTARGFLAKECTPSMIRQMTGDDKGLILELHKKISELGWLGLDMPEMYGGFGGGFLDVCILTCEMGRVCFLGPFFSTGILAKYTILEAGSEDQKENLLPDLVDGQTIICMAVNEEDVRRTGRAVRTTAKLDDGDYIIDGNKHAVLDSDMANFLIVLANSGESEEAGDKANLFLVDATSEGLTMDCLESATLEKQWGVNFKKVKVPVDHLIGEIGKGKEYMAKPLLKAASAKCTEMVGGAQSVLDLTVQYAKERQQFGQPIGSFQVLQHYFADMMMDIKGVELVSFQAAWEIDQGLSAHEDVAIAKAWAVSAYKRVCLMSHKIHGAIGFTEEHDLHLYSKQAVSDELFLDYINVDKETIAEAIGL